jgi:hypothetical protein
MKCRKLLDYVVELANSISRDIGSSVSVVSSRDLRAGKEMPHLFSRSEVGKAVASRQGFLSNPSHLHTADTFSDLLLSDSPPCQEVVECDGASDAHILPRKAPYQSDKLRVDVYKRAAENHREDIDLLVDPDVMADSLFSEGVFTESDQEYVATAGDGEKASRLLEKVEEKGAYFNCFSILHETGEQLPAHGRLWDILNDTCKEIDCSGSLNNFYLERDMGFSRPSSRLEDSTTTDRPSTTPSERVTHESGYGTRTSVTSRDLSTQPPSLPASLPPPSSSDHSAAAPSSLLGTTHPHTRTEMTLTFECSAPYLDDCSPADVYDEREDSPPIPCAASLREFRSSVSIAIPRNTSSCSLRPSSAQGHATATTTSIKGTTTSMAKHLSSGRQTTSFLGRIFDALFSAPSYEDTKFPGLKNF